MFIWLASYPKSGNTLVRSLLSAYFFSNEGNLKFELLNTIAQFPYIGLFKQLGIDTKNEKEVIKNYLNAQRLINKQNSIQFLKTHSYLFNIDNYPFTSLDYTLGVIYIVRDPRNVVLSLANHLQTSHEDTLDLMIKDHIFAKAENRSTIYSGTWATNYTSWKPFKKINKYLLVKYEDLIKKKEKTFYEILKFTYKLNKSDFILNKKKFQNTIETTSFSNMQKLEENNGFKESMTNEETGKKVKFFYLGPNNNWKNQLSMNLQKKTEENFKNEMIELGYL